MEAQDNLLAAAQALLNTSPPPPRNREDSLEIHFTSTSLAYANDRRA